MRVARRKRRIVARIKKLKSFDRRGLGTYGQILVDQAEQQRVQRGLPPLSTKDSIVDALVEEGLISSLEVDKALGNAAPAVPITSTDPNDATGKAPGASDVEDSGRMTFKRHAAERKAVKAQIAILKKERLRLKSKNKADKNRKREINKTIKLLLHTIDVQQAKGCDEDDNDDVAISDDDDVCTGSKTPVHRRNSKKKSGVSAVVTDADGDVLM
eukprot:Lankesteria_metandrocarpae@DN5618_c0_g1_i1.p2